MTALEMNIPCIFLAAAVILAVILIISNCPRLRLPHPSEFESLNYGDIKYKEKKLYPKMSGMTPVASGLLAEFDWSPKIR